MPERLRPAIVLCYLQGLTYAEAAHQLGLSEVAIRGRLARARERLRRRLIRRGVTVPAGLLAAGAVSQAQAAIPLTLIHSTIRIALGFVAGNTAAILARGVLNSMLLNQLKVARWSCSASVSGEATGSGMPSPVRLRRKSDPTKGRLPRLLHHRRSQRHPRRRQHIGSPARYRLRGQASRSPGRRSTS